MQDKKNSQNQDGNNQVQDQKFAALKNQNADKNCKTDQPDIQDVDNDEDENQYDDRIENTG